MGRALFSHTYPATAPTVRTEPEPQVDICEKYSPWNRFDPDSDDFFENAEYEAFIDIVQLGHQQVEIPLTAEAEGQSESSDSTDSGASDQDSPMAVGSDDPAILIADTYSIRRARWEDFAEYSTEPQWTLPTNRSPVFVPISPMSDQSSTPPFIPPAAFREASPGPEVESIQPPRSPTIRRTVNITPIVISRTQTEATDRSPSPESPPVPSTPPMRVSHLPQSPSLVTPSPPPSVTPRFYSWQHHSIPAVPVSPTRVRGNRDGPLTNPRARMSFARIEASPARIRIPNTVM